MVIEKTTPMTVMTAAAMAIRIWRPASGLAAASSQEGTASAPAVGRSIERVGDQEEHDDAGDEHRGHEPQGGAERVTPPAREQRTTAGLDGPRGGASRVGLRHGHLTSSTMLLPTRLPGSPPLSIAWHARAYARLVFGRINARDADAGSGHRLEFITRLGRTEPHLRGAGYAIAIAGTALLTLALLPFRNDLTPLSKGFGFLCVVVAAAAVGGLAPGVVASFLGFLTFNYFFIPPYGTFTIGRPEFAVVLFVFLGLSVVISELLARATERAHCRPAPRGGADDDPGAQPRAHASRPGTRDLPGGAGSALRRVRLLRGHPVHRVHGRRARPRRST